MNYKIEDLGVSVNEDGPLTQANSLDNLVSDKHNMGTRRDFLKGMGLVLVGSNLIGCNSPQRGNIDKAYDFAYAVSQGDPNDYTRQKDEKSIVYHDKDLTVANLGFGFWPIKGKGLYIKIKEDGLSVSEYDQDYMNELSKGDYNFSQIKGRALDYINNEKVGERIIISNGGEMISYTKSNGNWKKKHYDTRNIKGGMKFESFPTLSEGIVGKEEVSPLLEVIANIRRKYQ